MNPPQVWFTPVPRLFWSEYADAPFERCIDCDCELQETDFYLIQKCYVGTEPVFEFAICHACRDGITARCSEETSQAVHSFLMEYLSRRERDFEEFSDVDEVLNKCLNECIVCCKARSACHRYNIAGLFHASDLVVQLTPQAQSPLMICQDCESSMSDLISQQTRDTWDRFVEENFDGPPGVDIDLPTGAPVLI